jgi:hypothetical protein
VLADALVDARYGWEPLFLPPPATGVAAALLHLPNYRF